MPSELFESIKIPKERVGALIGTGGKVKRKLEKLSGTVIEVDSDEGIVSIEGKGDSSNFYNAASVVKAIGRGFSPENAFLLLDEHTMLDVVKVSDLVGGGEKSVHTKKARVIGTDGTARQAIERETGAKISVFGKTISIIGTADSVELARKAVELLLYGATHKKAMDFMKKEREGREKFSI